MAIILGITVSPAKATPGGLDPSFGTGGIVTTAIDSGGDSASAMVVQPDGKIVLAGYSSNGSNSNDFSLARYNLDGTLDTTFNGTGKVTTDFSGSNDQAYAVALQSDGKIVAAGSSVIGTRYCYALARYNANGSLDTSFGPSGTGKVVIQPFNGNSNIYAVAVQSDGKIVVAGQGYFTDTVYALARFNTDGTLDSTFGSGGVVTADLSSNSVGSYALSMVLQSDGKIVVGGTTKNYGGGGYGLNVLRFNTNGSIDSSFNGTGYTQGTGGAAVGLALQTDGSIVVADNDSYSEFPNLGVGAFALQRLTSNGSQNLNVYTKIGIGSDISAAVALQSDGKIVLAGYSFNGNTNFNNFALVRYNTDGSVDTGFNSTGKVTTAIGSGNATVNCVAIQSDGRILAAGTSSNGSQTVFTVARYYAYGNVLVSTPINGTFTNQNTPALSGTADPASTVNVYMDGVQVGSTTASATGTWSLTQPTALADGSHTVYAKETGPGVSAGITSNSNTFTVETVPPTAPVVLIPANDSFTNLSFPSVSGTAAANSTVTIYLDGTISGTATASGSGSWSYLPKVALANGTHTVSATATDQAGNTGPSSTSNSFFISTTTSGTPGALDPSFGSGGIVATVIGTGGDNASGMVVQPDGKVVLAGYCSNGNNNDFALARYNLDGTLDTTFNGTGKVTTDFNGSNDQANAVALQSDGKIVAAGTALIGTRFCYALARYNTDGSLDTSFGPSGTGKIVIQPFDGDSYIKAVAVQSDGKIVVAGEGYLFDYVFALVRFNADGTLDSTFGSGGLVTADLSSNDVGSYGMSMVLQGDGKIVVGGTTKNYGGGGYALNVLRFNINGSIDSSFNGTGYTGLTSGAAYGVALQTDGSIDVASNDSYSEFPNSGVGAFALQRLNSNGTQSLNVFTKIGIGSDISQAVALQTDGRIVLAGYSFNGNTSYNNFALVRYNTDGSVDTGFNSTGKVTTAIGSGNAIANSVAIQSDGRILVAGTSLNSSGTNVFTVARYFGSSQPPIVHTGAATGIQQVAATLNGTVNPNSLATTAYFQYGLTTSYGSVTTSQACGNSSTPVNVSASLTGLMPNTTYHYQLVAQNSATLFGGTTYGADATFTTGASPPVAVTAAAIGVSNSGATLAGVVFPNGYVTSVYFEYGLTTAYTNTTSMQTLPAGTSPINVFATLTGLIPGATYHYLVVANNAGTPVPVEGLDQTFVATDPPPTVVTGGVTELTTTSAQVTGTANANNATTQVFFDYGTDGVTFPNSVAAAPATVTGNGTVTATANFANLSQGITYYYRIRAVNDGGTSVGLEASLSLRLLSGFARQFPSAPPANQGFVLVTLTPSGITSGWRFSGEQLWRPSGIPDFGLTTGNYQVEYEPVPGYIQPPPETISVTSGGAATVLSREYFPTVNGPVGGLSVVLQPQGLAGAGWRILGTTAWNASGATINNLVPGFYLVECEPVLGQSTPAPASILVTSGQTALVELTYFVATPPTGAQPQPLSFPTVTNTATPSLPYAFVGQIRTSKGSSTGFAVTPHVVATAGHVVFDDATDTYISGIQWLFQRTAGTYEPVPVGPAGSLVFDGYATQRQAENTPGVSSPASQNLDVAALYFFVTAGGGGYSGYLASDSNTNEFLTSPTLNKMLVGYPVDGEPAANQGQMFATAPVTAAFAQTSGIDSSTNPNTNGKAYQVYTTTAMSSVGGNSGGPLCVQYTDGNYYPAAIYLGGAAQTGGSAAQTVVRSIDSNVIAMFDQAETNGNTGTNNTGGGATLTSTTLLADSVKVSALTVNFTAGAPAGAAWGLSSAEAVYAGGFTRSSLTPYVYTLYFAPVTGYTAPVSTQVTLTGGQGFTYSATYVPNTPPPAPTGVGAVAGTGQVSLSWAAAPYATSYNVKRSLTTGGPYTTLASPTGTSAVDTGLTNGTTYYYVVTAVNLAGESGPSAQVGAQPLPPLAAPPTGVAAVAGSGQVSLSWNASSGATSYNVKRSLTTGGPYTTVASPIGTGAVDPGLTNGTTYCYVVTAVNLGGESGTSSEVTATPMAGSSPPGMVTGLAAVANSDQLALSWTAVTGATSYTIGRSLVSRGPYTNVSSGGAATSFTNTGLTNGTTYYYVVAAVNGAGPGPNSTEVSGTPLAQNLYWDMSTAAGLGNGSGAWDTGVTFKWSNSSAGTSNPLLNWLSDDNAFFQTAGMLTATIASGATIKASSLTQALAGTALTVTGGTLQLDGNGGIVNAAATTHSVIVNSALVLNSPNVTIDNEVTVGSVQLLGVISETGGSRALTKVGTGTVTLGTVANTFSGGMTLGATGQVMFSNNASFGTGPITFSGGASLASTAQIYTAASTVTALANNIAVTPGSFGAYTGTRPLVFSGNLLAGAGTFSIAATTSAASVTLSGDNHAFNGTLVYNDNGSTPLLLGSTTAGSASAVWTLSGGSTKGISAGAATVSLGELTSATGIGRLYNSQATGTATFQIGDATTNAPSFGGIIADGTAGGKSGVTKTGTDNQILTGASTYTGATTIGGGILTVNGSLAAGSTVTINSGGTLAGSGTINGAANLSSGGSIMPGGTGMATLTFAGALSCNGGGILNFDLASATSDKIALTGAYVAPASGTVTINLNALGGFGNGTYSLITGATGISASSFTLGTTPANHTYQLNASGGTLSVTVSSAAGGPAAPTSLAAVAANAEVDLAWSASTGATSYTVMRGTTSGGPYPTVFSGLTATSVSDTGLTNGTTYYYVVTATNASGTSGNSNQATATPTTTTVDSYWFDNDIGAVGQTGNSSYSGGTFTLNGSGTGVSGTADSLDYTYQTLVGDGTIIARVATQSAGASGVLMRESLFSGARVVDLLLQAGVGAVFQDRLTPGGSAANAATTAAITVPSWVKLARVGNNFTGYTSPDGVTWTQVGTVTDTMATSITVGLAQTALTNASLASATFTNASIVPTSAWASQDIGTVPIVGASYYSNSIATVQGTGASLYTGADQFRYTYKTVSGDCDITARVASETNSNASAKAGVMIRAGLTATAAHATVYVTPTSGIGFEWRLTTGGTTASAMTTGLKAPYWLRLVRSGNLFTAYRSPDGSTWTAIGSPQTITMSTTVYIGLPICSYNTTTPCTATFDNITLDP